MRDNQESEISGARNIRHVDEEISVHKVQSLLILIMIATTADWSKCAEDSWRGIVEACLINYSLGVFSMRYRWAAFSQCAMVLWSSKVICYRFAHSFHGMYCEVYCGKYLQKPGR